MPWRVHSSRMVRRISKIPESGEPPPTAEWRALGTLLPILREAGGRFADWQGNETIHGPDCFASNGALYEHVLDILRHTTLVAEYPALAEYKARGEARPAYQRALGAQLADFSEDQAA